MEEKLNPFEEVEPWFGPLLKNMSIAFAPLVLALGVLALWHFTGLYSYVCPKFTSDQMHFANSVDGLKATDVQVLVATVFYGTCFVIAFGYSVMYLIGPEKYTATVRELGKTISVGGYVAVVMLTFGATIFFAHSELASKLEVEAVHDFGHTYIDKIDQHYGKRFKAVVTWRDEEFEFGPVTRAQMQVDFLKGSSLYVERHTQRVLGIVLASNRSKSNQ